MNRALVSGAVLAIVLSAVTRASAQPEPEDDVEVDVPASQAPPSDPPLVPPRPPQAEQAPPPPTPSPPPPAAEPAEPPSTKGTVSELTGLPRSTAPARPAESPPSLVAEGSNYVRPIRRGLTWWGFVQAQYEHNQISEDQLAPGGEPLNQDQFSLRRGRLRIDRGWENAAATLEIEASTFNGVRVAPRRAEASILYRGAEDDGITPLFVLTGGITDLPFGAEIGESQRDRVFMERSVGSLALFPSEADIGVKLWGAYRFLNYAVALVNGQPLNIDAFPRDPNAAKDVVGRVGVRALPADTFAVEGGLSFYQGKGFSPGRDVVKDSLTWVDDNNNGFAEAHEIQGVTGSAAVPSQSFRRWAIGLDAGVTKRTAIGVSRVAAEATVASNLDRGLLVSDPIANGADARQLVLSASALQQITDYGFVAFRVAYYDPNSDVFEQRAGVFHIKDESYLVLSPAIGLTLSHARLVAQYDFVSDHLARDDRGVPSNAKNDQLTLRLQVDL